MAGLFDKKSPGGNALGLGGTISSTQPRSLMGGLLATATPPTHVTTNGAPGPRTYPSFELYRDKGKGNDWRWRYQASNTEIIAVSSEGYKRRRDAEHGITLMVQAPILTPVWIDTTLSKQA
jgi:uncharacterized protein